MLKIIILTKMIIKKKLNTKIDSCCTFPMYLVKHYLKFNRRHSSICVELKTSVKIWSLKMVLYFY